MTHPALDALRARMAATAAEDARMSPAERAARAAALEAQMDDALAAREADAEAAAQAQVDVEREAALAEITPPCPDCGGHRSVCTPGGVGCPDTWEWTCPDCALP